RHAHARRRLEREEGGDLRAERRGDRRERRERRRRLAGLDLGEVPGGVAGVAGDLLEGLPTSPPERPEALADIGEDRVHPPTLTDASTGCIPVREELCWPERKACGALRRYRVPGLSL